ncbi:MAG: TIGR00341 family protein [Nitrospiraceae bacterium]|nr:TIGR00341 family protein [Nitrospiraceae bacterium]
MTKLIKITDLIPLIQRRRETNASQIDHGSVIKDIYLDGEMSFGYFLTLTLASLIALNGLIQNSIAVIIGAMLISPLMGPMLSFGFAFTTGNMVVWRKSTRKIIFSVVLSIAVAFVVTLISPLKDITGEIMSRTRPNLYDLFIAFFAGTAGAVAICTKKNYLTVVPGVAIATAVIPPLSVTGFGLGIWNFKIAAGGFLLFFTNFVSIVISTCIVFFMYGFSPKYLKEEDIIRLKRRIAVLTGILLTISIPLVYTVYRSVLEVRERNQIQNALNRAFNEKGRSHLDTFTYAVDNNGRLDISPVIETVSYMKESEISDKERKLNADLGREVVIHIEQILVQEGGLKDLVGIKPTSSIAPSTSSSEILNRSREQVLSVVRRAAPQIEKVISPSRIASFSVAFDDKTPAVSLLLKIDRDTPLSDDELFRLKSIFADVLDLPLSLSVETVPCVPLLIFEKRTTSLTDKMKKALSAVKGAYTREMNITVLVEAYPELSVGRAKGRRLAEQRVEAIQGLLTKEYGIPAENIKSDISKKFVKEPTVKVMVRPNR